MVDPPVKAAISQREDSISPRLCLFVPYSQHYRGLAIPELYEQTGFSSFDCLNKYFSYQGNLKVLFTKSSDAIDFVTFAYFLSTSLWLDNVRYLYRQVEKIAFKDILKPTMATNNKLHKHRQDLTLLRREVQTLNAWIFPKVKEQLESMGEDWPLTPSGRFDLALSESADLERFLIDTFQLLMSSISVLDSQTSILHAQRSTHLTQLATIYIPLSFVTGIFGMNIREINGAQPPMWSFALAMVVVAAFTAIGLYFTRQSRIVKRQAQ